MQQICTHTISVQNSTPSHAYPIIRLPREFQELVGSKAGIYQTAYDGKLAFLITVDKPVDKICANEGRSQFAERLCALEIEISELKSALSNNELEKLSKTENKWARPDSDRRPPPCEGDVITT